MEDSLRYAYSVEQFYEDCRDEFKLELLTPSLASSLPITVPDIHRPAFALTGFMEFFLTSASRCSARPRRYTCGRSIPADNATR
jgi:hypothetical protein